MYINTKEIKRYEGIDEIYVENIDETFTETIKIVESEELAVIVYLDLEYTELNYITCEVEQYEETEEKILSNKNHFEIWNNCGYGGYLKTLRSFGGENPIWDDICLGIVKTFDYLDDDEE